MVGKAAVGYTLLANALFLAAPYALVKTLSELQGLEPCQGQHTCAYFKLFGDGVLPGVFPHGSIIPTGSIMFMQGLPLSPNGTEAFLSQALAASHVAVSCPGASPDEMRRQCVGKAPRNTLSAALSGRLFLLLLFGCGAARLAHDVLVLHAARDSAARRWVASLSSLEFVLLAFSSCCASMWGMGALELFYAPLGGRDCGCYFEMGQLQALMSMAVPLSLLSLARARSDHYCCEGLTGPYLMSFKWHVPQALVEQSGLQAAGGNLLLARGMPGLGAKPPAPPVSPVGETRAELKMRCVLAAIMMWLALVPLTWVGPLMLRKAVLLTKALVLGSDALGFKWGIAVTLLEWACSTMFVTIGTIIFWLVALEALHVPLVSNLPPLAAKALLELTTLFVPPLRYLAVIGYREVPGVADLACRPHVEALLELPPWQPPADDAEEKEGAHGDLTRPMLAC